MTRLRRDQWASPHERARTRAGERLWEVLDAGEAEWLDRHLAECGDCRAVADSYETQRQELRALRDRQPVPPRDLWARTAAAIEREDARRRPSLRPDPAPPPARGRRRPSPVPLGALSGLLVVAVVVGVALLGGRTPSIVRPIPSQSAPLVAQTNPPTRTPAPAGTPIVVAAGNAEWIAFGPDGQIDVFSSAIDEVCADAEGPDCAPIEATPRSGESVDSAPQAVVKSPNDKQLVLVQGQTSSGPGKVVVVPVPTAPGSSPDPTPTARVTPSPPAPPPSSTPTTPIETEGPPPDVTPDPNETPVVTAPPSPLVTPSTTPGGPIEIASDVIVVGQAAAYSADGAWFAFSARPADGSYGPDIYVWRVGDPRANPITTDHRSVFSGWLDGRVLGSRAVAGPIAPVGSPAPSPIEGSPVPSTTSSTPPSPDPTASTPPAPVELRPEAFLLDPATGVETVLDAAPFWRPSVGPSGSTAIYWDGTVTLDENGYDWRPATGQLVVGPWPPVPAEPASSVPPSSEPPASAPPASEVPSAPGSAPAGPSSASPDLSAAPSASPSVAPSAPTQVLDDTPIRDWDARWDETGSHVAIWIADEADPAIGRLSHYVVDRRTGALKVDPKLSSQPALPGFSIGSGRIAWATPPNQNGEGSHIEVLAWTRDARDASGKVESAPGEDTVVVIR